MTKTQSLIGSLFAPFTKLVVLNRNQILLVPAITAALAAGCLAQSVTSARSGLLHYFEGDVSVDGARIEPKAGRFSEIKEQGVLCTTQGRAEVLLTPGVFLRVGGNSAIRMLDNRLASTRVEILSGTIIVESEDPEMSIKDPSVTLIYKDYKIQLVKRGLVEIGSDPSQMKVYKGEAAVDITGALDADGRTAVKEGRLLSFSKPLNIQKFDNKIGGDLFLWARDRSQSLSAVNMSSARSLNSSSVAYGNDLGSRYTSSSQEWAGGWYFNPHFNVYTFVPGSGTFRNYWGYGFVSPGSTLSYQPPSTNVPSRPVDGISGLTKTRSPPLSSLEGRSSAGLSALGGHMSANGGAGAAHHR